MTIKAAKVQVTGVVQNELIGPLDRRQVDRTPMASGILMEMEQPITSFECTRMALSIRPIREHYLQREAE